MQLNSLKQMADDLANFAANNSDVIVSSRENETFLACRFIIAARAPALLQVPLVFFFTRSSLSKVFPFQVV